MGRRVPPWDPHMSAVSVSPAARAAVQELLVSLPSRARGPMLDAGAVPAIIVRNTAKASPCGRRVVVWCHGGTETLETCFPDIQRAAAAHNRLDIIAPEYRGFGVRGRRSTYNNYHYQQQQQQFPTVPDLLDDLACTLKHASDCWDRPYILYGRGLGAELALCFATKLFFARGLDAEAVKAKMRLAVLVMEDPVLSPEFCKAVEFYGDCVECAVVIAVNPKDYSKTVLKRVAGEFRHGTLLHKNPGTANNIAKDMALNEALAIAAKIEAKSAPSVQRHRDDKDSSSTTTSSSGSSTTTNVNNKKINAGNDDDDDDDRAEIAEATNTMAQIFAPALQKKKKKKKPAEDEAEIEAESHSVSVLREWFRRRGYDAWLAETILRAGPRSLREIADAHPTQAQLAEFPFLGRIVAEARISVAQAQVPWRLVKKSLSDSVARTKQPKNRQKRILITEPPKSWNIMVAIKQAK